MQRTSGPLSIGANESVFATMRCDALVDDDVPLAPVAVAVTSSRLVVSPRGALFAAGAALYEVPFESVVLHARMPPDLASEHPSLYLQLDAPGAPP